MPHRSHRARLAAAGILGALAVPALAADDRPNGRGQLPRTSEIDMEGADIAGERAVPSGALLTDRPATHFQPLFRLRHDFDAEIGGDGSAVALTDADQAGSIADNGAEDEPLPMSETGDSKRQSSSGRKRATSSPECAEVVIVTEDGKTYTGRYVLKSPEVIVIETCDGDRVSIDPVRIRRVAAFGAPDEPKEAKDAAPVVVVQPAAPAQAQSGNGCLAAFGAVSLAALIILLILLLVAV